MSSVIELNEFPPPTSIHAIVNEDLSAFGGRVGQGNEVAVAAPVSEHKDPSSNTGLPVSSKSARQEHSGVEADDIAPSDFPDSPTSMRKCMGACFLSLFIAGWNIGATGALIPYVEKTFGIGYGQVAILFISTFLGYLAAGVSVGPLSRKAGFGRAFMISVAIELIGNVVNSSQQASFGLACFGFFVVGLAFAMQISLSHTYFATLARPLLYTSILQGVFGFGAFASPLVATAMIATHGIPYHLFYLTTLGMGVPLLGVVALAFHKMNVVPTPPEEVVRSSDLQGKHHFRRTLKSRAVWTLAFFLMFYVGSEDSIGAWIVTYSLNNRHATPQAASWVSASFYLGIAVGRIVLPPLNSLLGERRAIFIYILVALGLEALAWAVPVFAATAAATALIGFAISTFYAAAITSAGRLIPRAMHADAFALMTSIGQSGSALFPLCVGLISSRTGIWVVEPMVVSLLCAQGALWCLVPKVERKTE